MQLRWVESSRAVMIKETKKCFELGLVESSLMEYEQVQSSWVESSRAVMINEMKKCFRVGLS